MNYMAWLEYFFLTIVDALAATMIFFCALNKRMLLLPVWYRIGLICTALGFATQAVINAPYLPFGKILLIDELPVRILKDAGIGMVATHYFWQILRDRRKPGTPLAQKTPASRKPATKKAVVNKAATSTAGKNKRRKSTHTD
ncbi:hypothetical protein [Kalamiella sp. sgz302252]|uniref:hypothetical protein n=1 Tax=Pantoea sp. sgz302252 TaxID=3341827 RepID=UPI0036D3139F